MEEEKITVAQKRSKTPDPKVDTRTPEGLRARVLGNLRVNKDIPLRVLAATELNDMKPDHAAKSFSMFEYFFERHKEAALKWLKGRPASKAKELENFCKALGKSAEEIDEAWKQWVLLNY